MKTRLAAPTPVRLLTSTKSQSFVCVFCPVDLAPYVLCVRCFDRPADVTECNSDSSLVADKPYCETDEQIMRMIREKSRPTLGHVGLRAGTTCRHRSRARMPKWT